MPDAIVLRQLNKAFGATVAVRDLDLVVPQGALYGVIGPNGAGKTTTIRMILSILLPDRGLSPSSPATLYSRQPSLYTPGNRFPVISCTGTEYRKQFTFQSC